MPPAKHPGTLFATKVSLRQTLGPFLLETRGKLIPHRLGNQLYPALQLEGVGRHHRIAIFVSAKEEPRHVRAWFQAGRQ